MPKVVIAKKDENSSSIDKKVAAFYSTAVSFKKSGRIMGFWKPTVPEHSAYSLPVFGFPFRFSRIRPDSSSTLMPVS